jgi:hypothetical protein
MKHPETPLRLPFIGLDGVVPSVARAHALVTVALSAVTTSLGLQC